MPLRSRRCNPSTSWTAGRACKRVRSRRPSRAPHSRATASLAPPRPTHSSYDDARHEEGRTPFSHLKPVDRLTVSDRDWSGPITDFYREATTRATDARQPRRRFALRPLRSQRRSRVRERPQSIVSMAVIVSIYYPLVLLNVREGTDGMANSDQSTRLRAGARYLPADLAAAILATVAVNVAVFEPVVRVSRPRSRCSFPATFSSWHCSRRTVVPVQRTTIAWPMLTPTAIVAPSSVV